MMMLFSQSSLEQGPRVGQAFINSKISSRFYFRLASVSLRKKVLRDLLLHCKCLLQDIITTQENAFSNQ